MRRRSLFGITGALVASLLPFTSEAARKPRYLPPGEPVASTIVLFRDPSTVNVVNTTTETELFSYELPAFVLGSDRAIRLVLRGDYKNNDGANRDFRFRVYLGSTLMWDDTLSQANDSHRCPWLIDLMLMELAVASQLMNGFVSVSNNGATPPTVGEGALNSLQSPALVMGVAAEDETTALTLTVTMTLGTASANLDFKKLLGTLELL